MSVVELYVGNHTFMTFAKFSEKLTFVTLMICIRTCARIRGKPFQTRGLYALGGLQQIHKRTLNHLAKQPACPELVR